MVVYIIAEAIAAVIAGIVLAVSTKKAEGVVYGKLDKAGRITNILLLIVYVCLSPCGRRAEASRVLPCSLPVLLALRLLWVCISCSKAIC